MLLTGPQSPQASWQLQEITVGQADLWFAAAVPARAAAPYHLSFYICHIIFFIEEAAYLQ